MTDQIRASHILIAHSDANSASTEITRDDALKQIALLSDRLKAGEDFGGLAREWSDCPSAGKGGDLGFFSQGDMVPEFDQAAFSLKVDETSDVVETDFGFHLIHRTA